MPAPKRGDLIRRLANRLRDVKTELGELVTLEMGKIAAEGQGEPSEAEASASEGDASETPSEPEDPREVYNRGIAAIGEHDLEEAEHFFRNARRDAGGDGVLRFHAAYNLGWTLAGRAEASKERPNRHHR